jgi:hypothetical protein
MSDGDTTINFLRKSSSVDSALSEYNRRSPSPTELNIEEFANELLSEQQSLSSDDVPKLMNVEEKIAATSPDTANKISKLCADLLVEAPKKPNGVLAPPRSSSKAPPKKAPIMYQHITLKMAMHMIDAVKESKEKTNKICEYYVKMLIAEDKEPEFFLFPTQVMGLFKDLDSENEESAKEDFTAKMNIMTSIGCLDPMDRALVVNQLARLFQGGHKANAYGQKPKLGTVLQVPKDPLRYVFAGAGGVDPNNGLDIPSGEQIKKRSIAHLKKQLDSNDKDTAVSAATLLLKWQKSLGIQENDQVLQKATSVVQAH